MGALVYGPLTSLPKQYRAVPEKQKNGGVQWRGKTPPRKSLFISRWWAKFNPSSEREQRLRPCQHLSRVSHVQMPNIYTDLPTESVKLRLSTRTLSPFFLSVFFLVDTLSYQLEGPQEETHTRAIKPNDTYNTFQIANDRKWRLLASWFVETYKNEGKWEFESGEQKLPNETCIVLLSSGIIRTTNIDKRYTDLYN